MGPIEVNIRQQAKLAGDPLPDRIKNKPRLRSGLSFYYQAFLDLDTERDLSAGAQQIPWSAIVKYAAHCDCDQIESEEMEYLVRYLDNIQLERIIAANK